MELFIQIRNGQPFEHPIFSDNFKEAFPDVDVNNLPPEFAKFERVEQDVVPSMFEVAESTYTWVDGIVKDVWSIRPMTTEEESEKRQSLSDSAIETVNIMKKIAQQNVELALTEEAKQIWINYIDQLNAWVLVDPTNPNYPLPPKIGLDGSVMLTNQSGTEPNVIG